MRRSTYVERCQEYEERMTAARRQDTYYLPRSFSTSRAMCSVNDCYIILAAIHPSPLRNENSAVIRSCDRHGQLRLRKVGRSM